MASVRLPQLLQDEGNDIVTPGVYDAFTARLALKAGFKCLYMVRRVFGMKFILFKVSRLVLEQPCRESECPISA